MTQQLQPGIYASNERGYVGQSLQVIELAYERGAFQGELACDPLTDPDMARAIEVYERDGGEAMAGFIELTDPELLQWLFEAAEEHLEGFIPEGCWCGYSEGFGDWGVWEMEDEDE